jgi:hypothetical protein
VELNDRSVRELALGTAHDPDRQEDLLPCMPAGADIVSVILKFKPAAAALLRKRRGQVRMSNV